VANPQHLQILEKGADAFNRWRQRHQAEVFDLAEADLRERNLQGFDLAKVILAGANLQGAALEEVNFAQANLQGANLRHANLRRARCRQAIWSGADLTGAVATDADLATADLENVVLEGASLEKAHLSVASLKGATLRGANLKDADLSNADLSNADLSGATATGANFAHSTLTSANLSHARLESARFGGAKAEGVRLAGSRLCMAEFHETVLVRADLTGTNCAQAEFDRAQLKRATVAGADFREARLCDADLTRLRGAGQAKHLDTTQVSPDARYFDTCRREWTERWLSWEVIRTIGNLKLFAVSYSLLAFLLTMFYVVGLYNEKVMVARQWAEGVQTSSDKPAALLAEEILRGVDPFLFSWDTVLLFGSTIILVMASIIYTFGCPAEIKDFTEPQWRYQLGRSLVHYWSLAWRGRRWRLFCGILYLVGGIGFVPIIGYKLLLAFVNVCRYQNISPLV